MNSEIRQFYAHSLPDKPPSYWQKLEDQSGAVARGDVWDATDE